MTTIKNVALIGASGSVGSAVIDVLLKTRKFNVTVLTRPESSSKFSSAVKTVAVDHSDVAALTKALHGIDAVVSTVAFSALDIQFLVIDAAVAAGVQRFLPSEYGYNLSNPKTAAMMAALPTFGIKNKIQTYIEEKATANPSFSYTYVYTGGFIDWGLEHDFLLDLRSGKPRIFDGGDRPFSVTTIPSAAKGIVGVLEHPAETWNRGVYLQDMLLTQNRILELARKVAPEETRGWEPVYVDCEMARREADEKLKKGDTDTGVLFVFLFVAFFGQGYGGVYTVLDNELLGVEGDMEEVVVEDILRGLLK